jgi:hypothetical protein
MGTQKLKNGSLVCDIALFGHNIPDFVTPISKIKVKIFWFHVLVLWDGGNFSCQFSPPNLACWDCQSAIMTRP